MLTLKKVKELVNAPVHTKRVPSPKVLLEEGRIFLRKEFEHGSHLTLYHNGYVWFSAGKRNTVFHIHDCRGDYAYGASKGKGEVIKEEYFENCEWYIRALFEGEQRVEESQLKCEGVGQTKVSVSYHAVAEDWGEMADSEINVLDTLEVNRLCTDGTPNACSILYAAAYRAARAMGYNKVVTYILDTENGSSLKAAGYTCEGRAGGLEWNGAKAPKQADQYPRQMKTRWVKKKEGLHGS